MSIQRFFIVLVAAACLFCAVPAGAGNDLPMLTTQTFASTLKTASHPVLVEFKARWCPFCKKQQPDIEALRAARAGSLDIYQVDVDDEPDIAADYDAHVLPTMIIFWHGNVMGKSEGALYGEDLTDWIKDVESGIKDQHKSVESDSPQPL